MTGWITGQLLWGAACDGDAAKVSTLLSTQGSRSFINYQDVHGVTPLLVAAQFGHAAVTKQLLAARCNVDLQMVNGATPLHWSAYGGHEAVTSQLLAARCNVVLQADDGATALQLAEDQGHAAVATLIRNRIQEYPLLGRRVVINGLVARPELNGRTGTAVSFDDDKGRYSVELDDTSSFMIKPCNLLPTQVCSVALCSLLFSHLHTGLS
jgi:ankyrin repeat protein